MVYELYAASTLPSVCHCRPSPFRTFHIVLSILRMSANRRFLAAPADYDEISIEVRQTKRGSRVVKKRSPVHFHRTVVTSVTENQPSSRPPAQVVHGIPPPADIVDYHEVTFDPMLQRVRQGKVRRISFDAA